MPPPTVWAQSDAFPATLDHRRGCLALDPAYAVETNTAAFAYTPDAALDAPTPFVYGFVLPTAWYPHRLHHADAAAVQTFRCALACDTDVPDCVYRCGLYAKTRAGDGLDAWEVVHADEAAEWTHGQPLVLDVPTAALAGVYAAHRNRALDPAAKAEAVEPALVVGFARVDFGQPPAAHTMRLEALTVETAESTHGGTGAASAANACATPVLTTLRTPDQLAQPVAVLTETALAPYVGLCHDRPLTVQFVLQGTCAGVDRLAVVVQPATHPPTVVPALVRPEGHSSSRATSLPVDGDRRDSTGRRVGARLHRLCHRHHGPRATLTYLWGLLTGVGSGAIDGVTVRPLQGARLWCHHGSSSASSS